MAAAPRTRPEEGPIVLSVRPHAGAVVEDIVSLGRTDQARSERDRKARRTADLGESRVPGNLLRGGTVLCGLRRGIRRRANACQWRDRKRIGRSRRAAWRNSQVHGRSAEGTVATGKPQYVVKIDPELNRV